MGIRGVRIGLGVVLGLAIAVGCAPTSRFAIVSYPAAEALKGEGAQLRRNEKVESPHNSHEDDKPVKSAAVTSKRDQETHETTLSYWTPERMRSATPVALERSHCDKEE